MHGDLAGSVNPWAQAGRLQCKTEMPASLAGTSRFQSLSLLVIMVTVMVIVAIMIVDVHEMVHCFL